MVKLSVALLKTSGKPAFLTFLYYIWCIAVCTASQDLTKEFLQLFLFIFHFLFSDYNSLAEGDNTTQVVLGVVFNYTISKAQLPQNEAIVQTLVDAANSNNSHSVKVNPPVQIICKPTHTLLQLL